MPSRLASLEGRIDARARRGGSRAAGIERDVDDFRRDFDAREYSRDASQAAYQDFAEEHGRAIRDLRGEQVGAGRLNTGFRFEDEDQLTQDFQDRLSRDLARNAFTAARLDLENQGAFAAEGIEARRASDSALAGLRDVAQARENERRERRRGLLGFLGGAAGGIGGFLLGGPAGAAAGARIGGELGNAF